MTFQEQEFPNHYISRKPILDKLILNEEKGIVYVSAGAGYGKTTAILEYLKKSQNQFSWYSVYDHLNYPQAFYKRLFQLLEIQEQAEMIDFLNIAIMNNNLNPVVDLLLKIIESQKEVTLVFDNIHLITDGLLKKSIHYFLSHLPQNLKVILISRTKDWLLQAEFLLKNQLLNIEQTDFELDDESAESLLSNQLHLSEAETKNYVMLASGWITGLQLLTQIPVNKVKDIGSHSLILDEYLYNEIFTIFSREIQEFLLVTSQLPFFTEKIAEILFPSISFQYILDVFYRKNMMLQQTNLLEINYEYHDLWQQFLENQFEKQSVEIKQKWRTQLVKIMVEQREFETAVEISLKMKDYQQVIRIINQFGTEFYWDNYLLKVPDEVALSNINFMYYKVIYYYTHFEVSKCVEMVRLLEEKYPNSEEVKGLQSFLFLIGEGNNIFEIPYNVVVNDIEKMELTLFSKAILILTSAAFMFYRSEFREGIALLKEGSQLIEATKNKQLYYMYRLFSLQMLEGLGELPLAEKGFLDLREELIRANKKLPLFSYQMISQEISMVGIYLKQMKLKEAEETLSSVEERVKRFSREGLDFAIYYNQAEFFYLNQEIDKANHLTTTLYQSESSEKSGTVQVLSFLLKYSFIFDGLSRGQQAEILDVLENREKDEFHVDSELLLSLIYAKNNRYEKAQEKVDQVIRFSRQEKVYLKLVESNLQKLYLLLLTNHKITQEFYDYYKEALYYACDYQIKSCFYLFKDVLRVAEEKKDLWEKTVSTKEKYYHEQMITDFNILPEIKLTKREVEVLELLKEGLTNKEISHMLFISEATTKTHVLNIYQKLSVNSRVSAVQKAQELKLI